MERVNRQRRQMPKAVVPDPKKGKVFRYRAALWKLWLGVGLLALGALAFCVVAAGNRQGIKQGQAFILSTQEATQAYWLAAGVCTLLLCVLLGLIWCYRRMHQTVELHPGYVMLPKFGWRRAWKRIPYASISAVERRRSSLKREKLLICTTNGRLALHSSRFQNLQACKEFSIALNQQMALSASL